MQTQENKIVQIISNPNFWGALLTLAGIFGIDYFQKVSPDVLVGAILTIVGVFAGTHSYQKAQSVKAAANLEAADKLASAQVEATQTAARAQMGPVISPAQTVYKAFSE